MLIPLDHMCVITILGTIFLFLFNFQIHVFIESSYSYKNYLFFQSKLNTRPQDFCII